MRLDLLLDREPFKEVFSRTLSGYLASQFSWSGKICWQRSKPLLQNYFLVNKKLNLIYPQTLNTQTLRLMASEYGFHPNLIRRKVQQLYVHYAITIPLRSLLSTYYVLTDPLPVVCANWCIIPGNSSIRIVDLENNECIVLQKDGFNKNHMRDLINIRKQYPELPGPKIYRSNLTAGWYVEERIQGLPLNRLGDNLRIKNATNSARQSMLHLYKQTSSKVDFLLWRQSVTQKINDALDRLPEIYPSSLRQQVTNSVNNLVSFLVKIHTVGMMVDTAQSHGDFQPANILIPTVSDQRNVYLIDWEYTDKRCRWYDAMVFELNSRSPIGLAGRVHQWLSNEDQAYQSVEWCGLNKVESFSRYVIFTFLLEDLLFRLVDTTIPGLRKPDKGFLTFVDELSLIKLD